MLTPSKLINRFGLSPGTIRVLSGMLLLLSTSFFAAAQQPPTRDGGERRGPPPEAYAACASAALNDSCSVETPRETLTGICKTDRRKQSLICVPEGMEKRRPPKDKGERPVQENPSAPESNETN